MHGRRRTKRENTKLEEENLVLYRELHPSEDEFEDAEG